MARTLNTAEAPAKLVWSCGWIWMKGGPVDWAQTVPGATAANTAQAPKASRAILNLNPNPNLNLSHPLRLEIKIRIRIKIRRPNPGAVLAVPSTASSILGATSGSKHVASWFILTNLCYQSREMGEKQ